MFELRPYQAEAKQAVLAEWEEGHRKTLLIIPTAGGKTCIFSSIVEHQVNLGHRVLIVAHRSELLSQAADRLKMVTGLDAAFEQGESHSLGSFLPVTVGSVQSLCQERNGWRLFRRIIFRTSSWTRRTIAFRTAESTA